MQLTVWSENLGNATRFLKAHTNLEYPSISLLERVYLEQICLVSTNKKISTPKEEFWL